MQVTSLKWTCHAAQGTFITGRYLCQHYKATWDYDKYEKGNSTSFGHHYYYFPNREVILEDNNAMNVRL